LILLLIFLITSNNLKSDGFWQSLRNGISSPFRPVWGSYIVSGQNNSAPLALFKRTTFEKDKTEIIQRIKVADSDFRTIYEKIFENATNFNTYTIPAATGAAQIYETRATFAKNAAFVLVLGVNQNGGSLSRRGKRFPLDKFTRTRPTTPQPTRKIYRLVQNDHG
jgi:hypothetical protein